MKVSAVVVSRMDHPLGEVLDSIRPYVEELIVVRGHDGVWERWEAVARAKCDIVYTQDDDAVVNVAAVLEQYEPGVVTCNMPNDHRKDYPDGIALVGWGAVFDKEFVWGESESWDVGTLEDWAGTFRVYEKWAGTFRVYEKWFFDQVRGFAFWEDPIFHRECDRVFTGLSPLKLINVPVRHLPQAHGADRMGREARHGADLREIRRRIYAVRNSRAGNGLWFSRRVRDRCSDNDENGTSPRAHPEIGRKDHK